jgi:8-oxo-dGTP diphosphatase
LIAQAFIRDDDRILMVRQYVQRGDIVWNFPGGGIEEGESPEEACIREVKEETGLNVVINRLLHVKNEKYSFHCEVIGGELFLDKTLEENADIMEIAWVHIHDERKQDTYTKPFFELIKKELMRDRVHAAIIKNESILMVHEIRGDRDYWTLPGGAIESGESHEEAVIREVREETNLEVRVIRPISKLNYSQGYDFGYLVEIIGESVPSLGYDPELSSEEQVLMDVQWKPLKDFADDIQVSIVIKELGLKNLIRAGGHYI